jgi:hypothetical protein
MTKEIRLNAFDMNCVGHIQHGMWTHPRDRSTAYNTIEYWQDLARLAERGKFDGIFLADIVGVYDVYRAGPAPSIIDAVQIPVNDPMMVVPVMAAVTEHIGFGVRRCFDRRATSGTVVRQLPCDRRYSSGFGSTGSTKLPHDRTRRADNGSAENLPVTSACRHIDHRASRCRDCPARRRAGRSRRHGKAVSGRPAR